MSPIGATVAVYALAMRSHDKVLLYIYMQLRIGEGGWHDYPF